MVAKRANGQFYTLGNPFALSPFQEWAEEVSLGDSHILEPFAGANHIINSLQKLDLCNGFTSYDIEPADKFVQFRDTIDHFPKGFETCVTNPPWLARNSATRRKLPYPNTAYDDLYKHCLELCLFYCKHVAALIPASFLQSGLFRERLCSYILLHDRGMFNDTDNPVCLALFNTQKNSRIKIHYDNEFVGYLDELESMIPAPIQRRRVRFNDPEGNLGFISFDNVRKPSIRFCEVNEIKDYPIKVSSRFFTRISGEFDEIPNLVKNLNRRIEDFRQNTQDLFLTPFKGIRKDGRYRRRMEFVLARRFINDELENGKEILD